MSIPTFQLPDELFSLADFLLTDPNTGQSAIPFYSNLVNQAEGATGTIPHWDSYTIGGTPHRIGTRSAPLEFAQLLGGTDMGIIPFLDWFQGDPRERIQQNVLANYNTALGKQLVGGDPTNLDQGQLSQLIQGGIIKTAFQDKLGDLNVDAAGQQQVLDKFFRPGSDWWSGAFSPQRVPASDPLHGAGQALWSDYLYNPSLGFDDPTYGLSYSDGGLQQLFRGAGLNIESNAPAGTTTNTLPGGNTVTTNNNGGVQPSPLNYMAPFLSLLGGGYPGLDEDGNPTWTPLDSTQWQSLYGDNGLFGPAQRDQIGDLLNPLPLSAQEQASRDILSGDPAVRAAAIAKYPELKQMLEGFDKILPGLEGQLAPTIPLYGQGQYNRVRNLADTGRRPQLEEAGTTYMTRQLAPQLAAAYGGQLGTFGSDFGGELANAGRLLSADIADTVNANQNTGLGMWNDMTSSQGLYDTQRIGAMTPLYQGALAARANAPLAYATDLSNFGGAARAQDEALRPGHAALDLYRTLLTGAAPSNLGYVAQGELPSDTASLYQGLAGQSASFGSGWGNLLANFTQGLGSNLGSNLFSGGGLDSNGNMGLLGDIGGMLGGLGSSIFHGVSGFFGGNNDTSGIFGSNNSAGGDNRNPYGWLTG